MSTVTCDISQTNVSIADNMVTCSSGSDFGPPTFVLIQGVSTASRSIRVSNSDLVVQLADVSTTSDSSLIVAGSTVRFVFTGANILQASSSAGLLCVGLSNVTLIGADAAGSARLVAASGYPGVGPGGGGEC
jgi:hypothetical protein